jgi:D-tyrosyl-tRNA(Tyr) deacylase
MRAVVQRVKRAEVTVDGRTTGKIEKGLLVFLGVEETDTEEDLRYICDKIVGLRIFEDAEDKLNLSVADTGGSVLLVSQFTLYGDVRKGKRPSFIKAARPDMAKSMYERAAESIGLHVPVQTGEFQAMMDVSLVNDGPVTILIDSRKVF